MNEKQTQMNANKQTHAHVIYKYSASSLKSVLAIKPFLLVKTSGLKECSAT